jgi:hypothetical protein
MTQRFVPLRIMNLLRHADGPLESGVVARQIHADRDSVQKEIPRLLKRGVITRHPALRGSYFRYSCDTAQYERYLGSSVDAGRGSMVLQSDNDLSRKLKFLDHVARGIHGESPVLAEIVADYRELRRQQSALESPPIAYLDSAGK